MVRAAGSWRQMQAVFDVARGVEPVIAGPLGGLSLSCPTEPIWVVAGTDASSRVWCAPLAIPSNSFASRCYSGAYAVYLQTVRERSAE